jgi:hypothetical protein
MGTSCLIYQTGPAYLRYKRGVGDISDLLTEIPTPVWTKNLNVADFWHTSGLKKNREKAID